MMTLSCDETSTKSDEHYSHFVSSQDPPLTLREERGIVSFPGGLGTRPQRVYDGNIIVILHFYIMVQNTRFPFKVIYLEYMIVLTLCVLFQVNSLLSDPVTTESVQTRV